MVEGLSGEFCRATEPTSEPNTAIEDGAKILNLYLRESSKTFIKPSIFILQHSSGFFSPVADNIAAKWYTSLILLSRITLSKSTELRTSNLMNLKSKSSELSGSRISEAMTLFAPNFAINASNNSIPI